MLVAAMNPMPGGKRPDESRSSPREIQSYLGSVSGPVLRGNRRNHNRSMGR